MPIYKLNCTQCDQIFDKILPSSNLSEVSCSKCNSSDIRRVLPDQTRQQKTVSTSVPAGALSGGSCSSGFS